MKKIWTYWVISLVVTIAFAGMNAIRYSVHSIIRIEFAASAASMHKYISEIGPSPDCYERLRMNTLMDYGFLVGYSALTVFSFWILADVFGASLNIWIFLLAIVTGVLDAIENIFLMNTATRQREDFSCFYYYVVRIKWAFALIPFIVISIVIWYGLAVLLRARKNDE